MHMPLPHLSNFRSLQMKISLAYLLPYTFSGLCKYLLSESLKHVFEWLQNLGIKFVFGLWKFDHVLGVPILTYGSSSVVVGISRPFCTLIFSPRLTSMIVIILSSYYC